MAGKDATIDWQRSPGDMARELENWKQRLLDAVFQLAETFADRIAGDARSSAPWTDRTGRARSTIFGRAVRMAMGALIVVGHGMYYGIFLERRWGGKYAAVTPALQRAYAEVMAALRALVS